MSDKKSDPVIIDLKDAFAPKVDRVEFARAENSQSGKCVMCGDITRRSSVFKLKSEGAWRFLHHCDTCYSLMCLFGLKNDPIVNGNIALWIPSLDNKKVF